MHKMFACFMGASHTHYAIYHSFSGPEMVKNFTHRMHASCHIQRVADADKNGDGEFRIEFRRPGVAGITECGH